MSVLVLKPGLLTTLQDRGRLGHAALGIGHAGAMDPVALRLANALAGNAEDAAALEFSAVGAVLRFDSATTFALCGAPFEARLDGQPVGAWQTWQAPAGSVLDVGRARHGLRGYLAVAGGFAVERVLGSAATDLNAALGPFGGRALRAGDRLAIGASRSRAPTTTTAHHPWSLDPRPWFDPDTQHPIRLIRGAHFSALDTASQHALYAHPFRIANDSNRVGLRLDGPALALHTPLERLSEAVAFGTLQLPPGGQPIVLMAEHPTTGGYPRIGQVAAVDLPRLAQRRPGSPVRFAEITLDQAQSRYLAREHALTRLIGAITQRLAS